MELKKFKSCLDFWGGIVYPKGYTTLKEAREGIGEYIKLYNKQRLHFALDYKTPDEVYFGKVNTTDFICQNWLEDVA